jgi:hypothetical protein
MRLLTPSVAAAVLPRELQRSRSPLAPGLRRALASRRGQDRSEGRGSPFDAPPPAAAPVRARRPLGPGRLPSVRSSFASPCGASIEADSVRSLLRSRASPCTLSPGTVSVASSQACLRVALPRPSLGSPLGSPRDEEEDAPHRLLQPTSLHEHPLIARFSSCTADAVVDRNEPIPEDRPPRRRTAFRRSGPEWRSA